jgi:anti-sigma regulatory factor (Ser/Thr protein kinase)
VSPIFTRRWSALAVPGSVPALRRQVVAFAARHRVAEPPLEDLRLAVSEALTNVVLHGYRHTQEPGAVDVTATVGADSVEVVVGDEGLGMSPRSDSPGAGLGLPLIARLAQRMEIRPRHPRGTEIRLCFEL